MGRLEICIDSYESAANAVSGGAHQLEVCSSLALGGLTPSIGLVRRLRASFPDMPLFVMIRPRGGDFIYTKDEVNVMLEDLRAMKNIGVTGFVFGAMDSTGALDVDVCKRLIQAARPSPCTLSRVFDLIKDWRLALKQAIAMGFKTVLTSGQATTAVDGRDRLKKMRDEARDQINIMAGSGVNSKTLPTLLSETSCSWYHGSASVAVESKMPKSRVKMGSMDTDVQRVTSKEEVRTMRDLIDQFFGSGPIVTPYY
ncbi:unnamed protein product [Haemonchus placei]|uniref:Copper homeostasis protein cutC homolog n=1 Tax=Haemonchus placei TaxID=6290 RepID=A0A0N4WYM9_HAEPC|nr:unnamed protein product [Haemonchus placei]